jgi:hypothetical protein
MSKRVNSMKNQTDIDEKGAMSEEKQKKDE